jgi:hypothetical protein
MERYNSCLHARFAHHELREAPHLMLLVQCPLGSLRTLAIEPAIIRRVDDPTKPIDGEAGGMQVMSDRNALTGPIRS